jgi:hypothetical protein
MTRCDLRKRPRCLGFLKKDSKMKKKTISTDDHIMVGEHRCEICNCKNYEHAWWSGWDAVLEEPENDEEVAEAEEWISRRIPLKKKPLKKKNG